MLPASADARSDLDAGLIRRIEIARSIVERDIIQRFGRQCFSRKLQPAERRARFRSARICRASAQLGTKRNELFAVPARREKHIFHRCRIGRVVDDSQIQAFFAAPGIGEREEDNFQLISRAKLIRRCAVSFIVKDYFADIDRVEIEFFYR